VGCLCLCFSWFNNQKGTSEDGGEPTDERGGSGYEQNTPCIPPTAPGLPYGVTIPRMMLSSFENRKISCCRADPQEDFLQNTKMFEDSSNKLRKHRKNDLFSWFMKIQPVVELEVFRGTLIPQLSQGLGLGHWTRATFWMADSRG